MASPHVAIPPAGRRAVLATPLLAAALAAALAGACIAGACKGGGAGESDASDGSPLSVDQLAVFVVAIEREGLLASWEGRAPRPFGLLPLRLASTARLDALADEATGLERRRLTALRDRIFTIQSRSDPGIVAATRALTEERSRLGLGDQVELQRALAEGSSASSRREAWMAEARAAQSLAPLLRAAARARTSWAARTRQRPFLEALGAHRGHDPRTAERLRRQVATALAIGADEPLLDPWDVEAGAPHLVARVGEQLSRVGVAARIGDALRRVGLPGEPAALTLVTRSDPRRFADFATYPVEPPGDVRVRAAAASGFFSQWATLHESGHAALALLASGDAPAVLRWPASDAVAEGVAKVFERLAFSPEWLVEQGVSPSDARELVAWQRGSERSRMRSILADTAFEDVLYRDPLGDLDAAHAEILRDVAGVRPVEGVAAWPMHRTLAVEPRGRFDYLLARCAQAAIDRRLRALPGGLLGDEAGRVLREDVVASAPGARFEEWFERAAGVAPACDAWLEDVAGVPAPPVSG